jgi:hypothetical protein
MKLFGRQFSRSIPPFLVFVCCGSGAPSIFAQETTPEPAIPGVSVSVNGSRAGSTFSGTPVLLKVALVNSSATEENGLPLILASDAGGWSSALRIEIKGPTGAALNWVLNAINNPGLELTLTEGYAELGWWLAPEESALLLPGSYTINAILDTSAVQRTNCWRGLASSVPATLQVQTEPAVLSEAQSEAKLLAWAEYAFQSGDPPGALTFLNLLLAQYPANIGALTLKGAILLNAGQFEPAREASDAALEALLATTPDAPEPPLFLMELQARIEAKTAAIVIRSIQIIGATLKLEWETQQDQMYQVERSNDLQHWEPFTELLSSAAATSILTTNLSGQSGFFRVRKP